MKNDPPLSPSIGPNHIHRAEECVRYAKLATCDREKESWLLIAEQWLRMALPQQTLRQKEFEAELEAKHTGQADSESMN